MKLLEKLKKDYPDFTFKEGLTFVWSPAKKEITYNSKALLRKQGTWTLLHELGHGILNHQSYKTDLELVELEAAAWTKAKMLAKKESFDIPEDYIQDCMDTYRDWLHLRSTCPACDSISPQISSGTYRCFNCLQEWTVTNSRFCRPYRRKVNKKTVPIHNAQALFN